MSEDATEPVEDQPEHAVVDPTAELRDEADKLATRLHTELVRATGRLQDPADLVFDAEHLLDPEALTAAIDALLEAKPHYATRKPTPGNVGQGVKSAPPDGPTDFGSFFR